MWSTAIGIMTADTFEARILVHAAQLRVMIEGATVMCKADAPSRCREVCHFWCVSKEGTRVEKKEERPLQEKCKFAPSCVSTYPTISAFTICIPKLPFTTCCGGGGFMETAAMRPRVRRVSLL